MKTSTIDKRTDQTLSQCLAVARPVSALAFDYEAHERVPRHSHSKAQLIYAVSGTMSVATQQGEWVLLPTRAVWVPAEMEHAIQTKSRLQMRTLFFDRTVIAPVDGCAIVEVSDLLRELILSMLNEPHAYSEQGRGSHLAALIQDELRFTRKLPLHLPFPKEPRLRRVCEAMQKRPTLRIDLEMWAAEFSVSGRTLARLFRKELNMSFMEWRMQSLLLEAQLRLAQGQKSSRIAQALGYENHAAFCAMFKRQLGTTPSQHLLGGAFDGSPTLLIEGARHGNSYLRHLSSPK